MTAKKKPGNKKAATAHKPSTKRTLEEVLSSLQDLAKNELSGTGLQTRAGGDELTGTRQPENPGVNNDKSEMEFTIEDSIQMDMPAPEKELESGQTGDIFDGLELLTEEQLADKADAEQAAEAVPDNKEESEIRWEDIPVLEDVAEDPPESDDFQAPDPKLARKIAIQVAARLNIEMHKQGLDGLDIATINRLRALLVKELAKAAAKSENDET